MALSTPNISIMSSELPIEYAESSYISKLLYKPRLGFWVYLGLELVLDREQARRAFSPRKCMEQSAGARNMESSILQCV
jgi:hypothetical protein